MYKTGDKNFPLNSPKLSSCRFSWFYSVKNFLAGYLLWAGRFSTAVNPALRRLQRCRIVRNNLGELKENFIVHFLQWTAIKVFPYNLLQRSSCLINYLHLIRVELLHCMPILWRSHTELGLPVMIAVSATQQWQTPLNLFSLSILVIAWLFQIQWNPDFWNLQGKRKLVRKIWEFEKSGGNPKTLTPRPWAPTTDLVRGPWTGCQCFRVTPRFLKLSDFSMNRG